MKSKIFIFILIIALLGVGAYFVLIHTDNLSTSFKSFYVKYNEHNLSTENNATYLVDTVHRFDVVYPFDFIDKEQKGFSVKVVPNTKAAEMDYVVDDRYYLFSGIREITSAFDIKCEEDYFTLTIPKDFTIKTVLEQIYPDNTVEVDERYLDTEEAYYTLIITSYNGTSQCVVNFAVVNGAVKDVTLNITRIEF